VTDRPNILYIFTDQQSAGALSCAGNEELHTPASDALAARGARFDRAYCTYPLCTPARASMFAGRMPHELGITGNGHEIDEAFRRQTLGVLLGRAGYDCAYGGKWHVPQAAIPDGEHGFRRICGFNDLALPEACAEFMAARRDGPFFLVASFDNPHNICEWRREQALPWGDLPTPPVVEDCPALPPNFAIAPFEAEAVTLLRNADPRIYPGPGYSNEQWRRYRWAYHCLVEKVDAQIGRVLDALEAAGLADRTLVLLSSDHGDHQGCHHLAQKTIPYEEALRVPLIAAGVGVAAGRVDRHLVSNGLDLYATVCDAAGVELPEGVRGRSLRPLLAGDEPDDWPDHLVCESRLGPGHYAARVVCTERYKYVAYDYGAYREQLFDLQRDPGEMVNLAVRSRLGEVLQQHRERLRDWCQQTGDTFAVGHDSGLTRRMR